MFYVNSGFDHDSKFQLNSLKVSIDFLSVFVCAFDNSLGLYLKSQNLIIKQLSWDSENVILWSALWIVHHDSRFWSANFRSRCISNKDRFGEVKRGRNLNETASEKCISKKCKIVHVNASFLVQYLIFTGAIPLRYSM